MPPETYDGLVHVNKFFDSCRLRMEEIILLRKTHLNISAEAWPLMSKSHKIADQLHFAPMRMLGLNTLTA